MRALTHFGISIRYFLSRYNIKTESVYKNIIIKGRRFNHINSNELNYRMESLDWNFDHYHNIDSMVSTLNNNIINIMNSIAPLKSHRVRRTPKHWFNNEMKLALDERKTAYDNWKSNNIDDAVTFQQLHDILKAKAKESP